MTISKKTLRQEALARRDRMRQEQRTIISQKLVDELQKLLAILKGKTVAGFWPIKSEIDPRPIMLALKEHGFTLALPALIDKTTMVFRIFEDERNLVIFLKTRQDKPSDFSVKSDKVKRRMKITLQKPHSRLVTSIDLTYIGRGVLLFSTGITASPGPY